MSLLQSSFKRFYDIFLCNYSLTCTIFRTDFIITGSSDGHVKFWKKNPDRDIEFVKHFRCHLTNILDLSCSDDGQMAATIADDQIAKIFDVVNFGK